MTDEREPSKMSPDEKRPTAETVESEQDAPITQDEFEAQMQRLTERARAAGLSPVQTMLHAYAERGRIIVAGMLSALEDGDTSKKKEKE